MIIIIVVNNTNISFVVGSINFESGMGVLRNNEQQELLIALYNTIFQVAHTYFEAHSYPQKTSKIISIECVRLE